MVQKMVRAKGNNKYHVWFMGDALEEGATEPSRRQQEAQSGIASGSKRDLATAEAPKHVHAK